ncbi:MAG: M23 family metallopeptidase [Leptospirales bacterium]|nr:M23 family metallopeptidase [Leptospirales bacterium]
MRLGFLLVFLGWSLHANDVRLTSLREGETLSALRNEIAINLKAHARGQCPKAPLRFVKYALKKDDNFFRVVTSAHQDPDTLASLNRLVSHAEIGPGDTLLIPNARGLFTESGGPGAIYVKELDLYFFPGRKFHPEERKLFRGDDFVYPLKTFILTSGYGSRVDPLSSKQTFHGGLDLAAPEGTAVNASRSGTVKFVGNLGGYGTLVVIDHGHGYKTLYGHLKSFSVKVNDRVRAGEEIGKVGSTGRSTGPHLHFEMRKDGKVARPRMVHGVES